MRRTVHCFTFAGDLTVPPLTHENGTVQDIFVTLGNRRLHMGDILRRESQRIAEIDACLENGPQAMKDVFMQLLNGSVISVRAFIVRLEDGTLRSAPERDEH
jgi:hypothetical protein